MFSRFLNVLLSLVLVLGVLVVFPLKAASEQPPAGSPPEVDFGAVEDFLEQLTASQQVVGLKVFQKVSPSPVPGLWEIRFQIEANGMRQTGVLYLSGDKIILGNVFDLKSRENLTSLRNPPPERIKYSLKDLDMVGRVPRGNPEGKLVIVEFSDFLCPYCRKATGTLKKLLAKYPDDVVLYYKHLPITQIHPMAYRMAIATECARDQKDEAFWSLHDDFFLGADIQTETQLRKHLEKWAGSRGIDSPRLLSCLDSPEQSARVDRDMADARKVGARATPTFLVNGEFLQGVQTLANFEKFLKD